MLDLSNANIGVIATPLNLKYWPHHIIFNNLTVGAFDFSKRPGPGVLLERDIDWLKQWLRLQDGYTAERYYRTRITLANSGSETTAAALGYVSRDRELVTALLRWDPIHASYLAFSKFIIRYGYQMWLPIIWAFLFIIIGATIFRRTIEAKHECMPYGIAYSFDMLLPLIKLRERHYKIDLTSRRARYYFYLHKTAGWLIGFFILAGLSGFTK